MKVPDKIYLNSDAATDVMYPPGEDDSKIEYIRKDALIEWFNDNIKPLNVLFGEIFVSRVKDKLKSL